MMNALTVLLLCLAAAYAGKLPVEISSEKTLVYNYYADVKAGLIEPAQYASQFALAGQLYIKKDVSDQTLNNAYYFKLHNLKYGMFNGMVTHHQPVEVVHELGEAAQQIQEPFVVVYNEYGQLQGVKMQENESGWSRNIKQSIASMLQVDFSHIRLQTPIVPHAFVTHEKTIHGTCQVTYDVHAKNPMNPENSNVVVVTKHHDLKNCSHFVQRIFDHVECEKCHVESVDDMTTAARRVFQIELQENNAVIKHMVAHSVINYFPYNARSEAHYLLTNTTLDLQTTMSTAETPQSTMNFQYMPVIRDVTFNKPLGNYALHAAEDLSHGRHIVKLDVLIPKLKKMLIEATDYLEENHLEAKEPEWKHGQTINRLQHTMSYMDLGSLEQVYNTIQEPKTPKEVTMKNIFLRMVPTVGTTAACHFTRNVIRKHKVSDATAIAMLIKLPMHVKVPNERLLLEMEDLLKLGNTVSVDVRKASILCFSVLVHKTFKHQHGETVEPLLDRYIHRFFDHVKNEQSYQMRLVYLMAMNNVQVGNIEKLLEPIIRGEMLVSEHPQELRYHAISAVQKVVKNKVDYTHNLFWPILANVSESLPIRIAAYEVLMSQMPNMQRFMSIYWLMVYEQNSHLYNHHFTTVKGLANSVDPCLTPIREMARKIMRFTRIRPVTTKLSSSHYVDYIDPVYEHGESFKTNLILNEYTGQPQIGRIEQHASVARKVVNKMSMYWYSIGSDDIISVIKKALLGTTVENISNKNVQDVLTLAAKDMPTQSPTEIDGVFMMNGYVVLANHYEQNIAKILQDILNLKQLTSGNYQEIIYDTLFEMQVPTDMGLQAVLSTRMPQLWSLKFNNIHAETKKPSVNMKFEVDARVWRHGEYVMSIYNPVADVWHSIRRSMSQDVALPIEMSVNYNHESKSLKITMPRLPITKLSHVGVRFYAKNLVTITEDEQDVLKTCCSTCHHHTVVTTNDKKNYQNAMDSKDMGLKYSTSIFDCENSLTPVTNYDEWHRVLSSEHKNTWDLKYLEYLMGIRQKLFNDYISPKMGSCGTLLKMEPSIVYPTSHVDLNVRFNVEDVDYVHEKIHVFNSNKINIRGTLDAKAASTNESARSWDMNVNIEMSQGHVLNNVKIQITRMTPGEKILKICVDAQKSYPVIETDPMKVDTTKEETNTKMTITAGFSDDDKCLRDEMSIVMNIKGEMTEEQKKQMTHDSIHSACSKDMKNPQFQTKQGHIPKTMNCIHEVIKYTTMKKYTINTLYKKVPVQVFSHLAEIEDHIRQLYLPHVKYITDRTESGNAKVVIEFSSDLKHFNASIVTPSSGYDYVEVPLHQHRQFFEGMKMSEQVQEQEQHVGWHPVMDNTRFTVASLHNMVQNEIKVCTVYPQVLITLDNGVIPFVVSDKWTLLSGDYVNPFSYAIFVKTVQGDKLAVRMFVADHEIEIMPNDFDVVVTVDGQVVDQHTKGVVVPQNELQSYAIKLTENNEHLVVQSQQVPVMMMWTPNSVSLKMDTALQGSVTGVCGHMDNTHKERLPKIYNIAHF